MLAPGRLLLISIRAINWAGWRLPSRQVTRITSMPRHNRLSQIAMAAAEARRAARLALGLRLTEAQVGLSWRVPRAARSEIAKTAPGDYPQNWYDEGIVVDPNDPERVFFDTFDVWFATRTGTTWNDTTCGYSYRGAAGPVHVDQHALAFLPGSSSILLIGNDGGAHGTTNADVTNSTTDPTWFNMDTGLNTIEFYSGDISGNFANCRISTSQRRRPG